MAIIKSIFKFALFIALILALGQIQVGQRTLAQHYMNAVQNSFRWSVNQVSESKWFADLGLNDFLKKNFGKKEVEKNRRERRSSDPEGDFSKTDRSEVLRLLRK